MRGRRPSNIGKWRTLVVITSAWSSIAVAAHVSAFSMPLCERR
jgi:hypothetical protein